MNVRGIDVTFRNHPKLDPEFVPFGLFARAYEALAAVPVTMALERADGVAVFSAHICGDGAHDEADCYYIDRIVKNNLWQKGGFRLYVSGSGAVAAYLKETYAPGGAREFDYHFMTKVYGRPLEVVSCTLDELPKELEQPQPVGGHMEGCRIGFDAGGSVRKVAAVIGGQTVDGDEVVWHPKVHDDWQYHYQEILTAMRTAASHMPRVDAIGISSAGVFVENRAKVVSLFIKLPEADFDAHAETMFTDVAKEVADVPCVVCNDGDVSALAGGLSLGRNNVLGIAMGTSEAVGFLNKDGYITGWLNELAFAPVDVNPAAEQDEWSGDIGVGCKYFSQDAVIKLARNTSIQLSDDLTPAQKLKAVQARLDAGDPDAVDIYDSIGVYLGHTLVLYHQMYGYCDALLMGRVMSGKGGDLVLERALAVLKDEYPEVYAQVSPQLPSEQARRIGQSVAAASLPAGR